MPLTFDLDELLVKLSEICISSEHTDFSKYRNSALLRDTLQKVIPELKADNSNTI